MNGTPTHWLGARRKMDPVTVWIFHQLGDQWIGMSAVVYLLYRSGIVGKFLGTEEAARAQLSEDQQRLVENLQAQVEELHAIVRSDRIEHDKHIARMRAECDEELKRMSAQIETLVAGEARWRHLTGNLASYVDALRRVLQQNNIEVPRFTGWQRFLEDGGDPIVITGNDRRDD